MAQLDNRDSLVKRWSKRPVRTSVRIAQAAAVAKKWEARSSAYATAGQFREADDAQTEANDLYALIDNLEVEGK